MEQRAARRDRDAHVEHDVALRRLPATDERGDRVVDDEVLDPPRRRSGVGLGEDFLARVAGCIRAICRTPKMHETVYKHYRRGLVRRFPYAVFYEYANRTVTVYAVRHTAQDPDKWRERLP